MSNNIIYFDKKTKSTVYDNITEAIYTAIDELATIDDGLQWEPTDLEVVHSDLLKHNPNLDVPAKALLSILWHRTRTLLSPMIKASSIDYNPGIGHSIRLINLKDSSQSGLGLSFTLGIIDEHNMLVDELINLNIAVLCSGMPGDKWPREKPNTRDHHSGTLNLNLKSEPFVGRGRMKVLLDTFHHLAETSDAILITAPMGEKSTGLIFHTLNQHPEADKENIVCLYTLSINNKYLVTEPTTPLM